MAPSRTRIRDWSRAVSDSVASGRSDSVALARGADVSGKALPRGRRSAGMHGAPSIRGCADEISRLSADTRSRRDVGRRLIVMTEFAEERPRAEDEDDGWPELTDAVLIAAFEGWNDAG